MAGYDELLAQGRLAQAAPGAAMPRSARELQARASALMADRERSSDTVREMLVRVRPGHSGAGASTIALALADAADAEGLPARLVDGAAPQWSGLLGAAITEIDGTSEWRRGRRGESLLVEWPRGEVRIPADVPAPSAASECCLTVLDVGWSPRELAATATRHWLTTADADIDVLVTAAHQHALAQSEEALGAHRSGGPGSRVVVIVLDTDRGVRRAMVAAGPLLRERWATGAVILAPPFATTGATRGVTPRRYRRFRREARRLLEQVAASVDPTGDLASQPAGERSETGARLDVQAVAPRVRPAERASTLLDHAVHARAFAPPLAPTSAPTPAPSPTPSPTRRRVL